MSRLRVQSTLTALAIGLLIVGTAMEVEAGRSGGGRGGRSFGRRSGGSGHRSGGIGRRGGFSSRGRGISRGNNSGRRNSQSRIGGGRNRGDVSSRGNRGNRGGSGLHISHRGSQGRRSGNRRHGWGFGRHHHHGRHHGRHHHHHGFGFGYYRRPLGFGFLYVSGGNDYYNPYCETPIVGYDYTTPVVPFDSATSESSTGLQAFDAAIASFQQEKYESALQSITTAARELPGNSDVHQFHGLVLFAMGKYKDSAAVVHASLTSSSGWNWDTLRSFYSAAAVYTKQLRALEEAKKAAPDAAELRFLLGYHYLMLNHKEAAGTQLTRVVALQPNNALAQQLLKLAGTPTKPESETTPNESTLSGLGALAEAGNGDVAEQPQAKQPVPETPTLVGSWTAKPVEGVVITLVLQEDGGFTWKVTTDGQTEEFSGKVAYKGNKVTLTQENSEETLEGTLKVESPQSFRFQLDDGPELTFSR